MDSGNSMIVQSQQTRHTEKQELKHCFDNQRQTSLTFIQTSYAHNVTVFLEVV